MYRLRNFLCLAVFASAAWLCGPAAEAATLKVPLTFEDVAGVPRKAWPVRSGIPLPQGKLPKGAEKNLRLLSPAGRPVAMVPKVLARWLDGSAKWVLVDCQVDLQAKAQAVFTLTDAGGATGKPAGQLRVTNSAGGISVDTGVLRFSVLKRLPGGVSNIVWQGKTWPARPLPTALVLDYQTSGPALNSLKMRGSWKRDEKPGAETIRLTAAGGKDYQAAVEVSTPLRVVIRTSGWYGAKGRAPACKYVVRYTAFAGKPFIKIQHTFVFTENAKTFFLRRLGMRFPFGKARAVRVGGPDESHVGVEMKLTAGSSAALLSVGPVINNNGIKPTEGSKKDVWWSFFSYKGDGADKAKRDELTSGKQALGFFTVLGSDRAMTVTERAFNKQHPDELSYSAADGAVECWLWANHGGKIVDARNPAYNKRIRGETRLGGIATGYAKTHEILLHFHSPAEKKAAAEVAAAFDKPVWPHAAPQWNCATDAYPLMHPYDPKHFPGLEKQIEILYAWININQKQLHWDGFFDYGGVLIEFDNHRQRYSGGPRGTWCWRDYAGWINEDGQQSHHFFMHYYRTGRRDYMRMGEAYVRRITEVCGVHYYNPKVPHSDPRVGGGHRHDMTPWHSFVTGYSMATLGAIDYYYLTGDERMRELLDWYAVRCDKDHIGPGYGGAHFTPSLVRFWEATGNEKYKQAALKKLANPKIAAMLKGRTLGGHFREPTDLYPHLIFQAQLLPEYKKTAQWLLEGAATNRRSMREEICAWAYLHSKQQKYLDRIMGSMKKWKRKLVAVAKLKDPWSMNWNELRRAMNLMPAWYVKVYINSQQVGRFPAIMTALTAAHKSETAP